MLVFFTLFLLIAARALLALQAAHMFLQEDRRLKLTVAIGLATIAAVINLASGAAIGVDPRLVLLVVILSLTLLPMHVLFKDE